ncbi:linker for activation of T-cells family member 2 isoform X4 [Mus musculus]|uniref:linker for activation of T-cells family member 2 isoform X4 n=1 Tax=Mus musculus TaxID=10090 RepID=UPI0003D73562|nr:linker for activation of T-cells family member 2 isoform X4 [Mus musculus]|eukprot:XP_006504518.1 PREDICTED: linker for activation of T-cells family member 2 isoform X4 [Mus musculus]
MRKSTSRGTGKKMHRAQLRLRHTPWPGRCGQDPRWTQLQTSHLKGRTRCCSPTLREVTRSLMLPMYLPSNLHSVLFLPRDPIPTNYYNWGCFQKPSEDDDSNSYENVLVCKPSTPESGVEDFEDYQNSVSIHQWRESKRTMGAPMSLSGSPDEEPDYVNGDVAAAENI